VPKTHIDPDGAQDGWIPTDDGATTPNEPVGAMTWYPNNNTPKDKATHRFAITVPTGLEGGWKRRADLAAAPWPADHLELEPADADGDLPVDDRHRAV
jgi:hypothetical protein